MEIKKLTDILEWADSWINGMKDGMTEEEFTVDEEVKAFEAVKKAVLDSMERHAVYTNALNKDIADKAAKIDLLEKEIEGRKEGYTALKERMDTKYISIEEHNNICKTYENKVAELEKELEYCRVKIRHHKENLNGINKTLEIRTKENESLIKQNNYLKKELEETYRTKEADLKNHNKRDMTLVDELAGKNDEIRKLKEEIEELKKENMDHFKRRENDIVNQAKCISKLKEEIKSITKSRDIWFETAGTHSKTIIEQSNTIKELETKYDKILHSIDLRVEENKKLRKEIDGLREDVRYWKEKKEDDHGRTGFKKYIEHLIEEEERAVPERFKKRLNEEIETIFTKEEETEVKGVGRTSSGRYPWGAKVNDIPCGEDSIE